MLEIIFWFALGLAVGRLIWEKFPNVGSSVVVAWIAMWSHVEAWISKLIKR